MNKKELEPQAFKTAVRNWLRHTVKNLWCACKAYAHGTFHLAHAILPLDLTDHNKWGLFKEGHDEDSD